MANVIYSNQANKIFIYNSAQEEVNNDEDMDTKNTSSITILTSGMPEYHIRIKSNFKNGNSKNSTDEDEKLKTQTEEHSDMKTLDRSYFESGEDVLLKSIDDKLYLGTIVDIKNENYLVKFDDNTEKWARKKDLKKLNNSSNLDECKDKSLCVICKIKDVSDKIKTCGKCCRGYHSACLSEPPTTTSPWCCDRCVTAEVISISDSEENDNCLEGEKVTLPYDITALKWDKHHRENKQNVYCYCGTTGSWKSQMLQCVSCQQWFHEKCIESWNGYLMHGDTFYVFGCKVCNSGKELIHRLHISWKTLVHLVLYDISITKPQKYFSVSKDLAPFLHKNWERLNLSLVKNNFKEKLVKKILQTLKQEDEFKLIGGNSQVKGDLVCLRRKQAPLCPTLSIPIGATINEKLLKKLNVKSFPLGRTAANPERKGSRKQKTNLRDKRWNIGAIEEALDDSSDENSSKSTLDWIIPPPSNFNGKNNPFHSQYKYNSKLKLADRNVLKSALTVFEKLPDIRIVRTFKRRLNAKDIALGHSSENKRRKISKRRKSSDLEIISEIIQPTSMPLPSYPPVRGHDSKDAKHALSSISNQSNGFAYGQADPYQIHKNNKLKQEECETFEKLSNAQNYLTENVMNSPVKNNSINLYFGAMNRIENGEQFAVVAKRFTFDGKEQYLLEWESSNANISMKKDPQN